MSARLIPVLTAILGLTISSITVGAAFSKAVLLVKVANYFGETHTPPPTDSSNYVFFSGEPIRIRVEIANSGEAPLVLVTSAKRPAESLSARMDGMIELAIGNQVSVRRVGGNRTVDWSSEFRLEPLESLVFEGDVVVAQPMAPGNYVIDFETVMTESNGLAIAPQAARFKFEIRARSSSSVAEEARRNAARALVNGDYPLAQQWVAMLLKANPESHVAHVIDAQIAEGRGDKVGATQRYARALGILEANGDQEYIRWADPRLIRQRTDELRAHLKGRP